MTTGGSCSDEKIIYNAKRFEDVSLQTCSTSFSLLGDRLYDITGDVTDKYKVVEWEHFDDELEKQRIVEYCITITKQ